MSKQRKSTSKAAKGNPGPLPLPQGLVAEFNEALDAARVPQVVIHHPPGWTPWPEPHGCVRRPGEDEKSFTRRLRASAETVEEMAIRNKHNAATVEARTDAELTIQTLEDQGRGPTFQRLLMEKSREEDEDRRRAEAEAKARALSRPEDVRVDATRQAVAPGASQIPASTDEFDAFLCHASEDKKAIVEPFAAAMERAGLKPWLDKDQGKWGDGLIHRIQNGLTRSRFVVVFVSADFLGKGWPEKELDAALSMEMGGRKVVLPILLGLTHAEVEGRYPMVSCKKYKEVPEYAPGKRVSKRMIAVMVDELKAFIS